MGKFTNDSKLLLEYVGGKENINAVSHCVTRMRFVLADPSKADVEKIESIPSAKGTFTQSGQFQVIIGNEVSDFYNEFTKIAGIEGVSKDAGKKCRQIKSDASAANHGCFGRNFCADHPCLDLRRSDSWIPQHHRRTTDF